MTPKARQIYNRFFKRLAWIGKHFRNAPGRAIASVILLALFLKLLFLLTSFGLRIYRSYLDPEAIVVLGGSYYVERFAAEIASQYPSVPVIVSSGRDRPCTFKCFVTDAGNDWNRIITDYRAGDTLTNFTSTLRYLEELGVRRTIIVTTRGHWQRAKHLDRIVYGSSAIASQARLIKGEGHNETAFKIVLDSLRAVLWLFLGDVVVRDNYLSQQEILQRLAQVQAPCQDGLQGYIPDLASGEKIAYRSRQEQVFHAIKIADRRLLAVFLAGGINPNMMGANSLSALAYALQLDRAEIAEMLFRNGADFRLRDKTGLRAIDYLVSDGQVFERLGPELISLGYLTKEGEIRGPKPLSTPIVE